MAGRQERPTLESFDISKKTGFLPEVPPLDALPSDGFDKWHQVFVNLIRKRELRAKVDSLPEFNIDDLHTAEQWRTSCFRAICGRMARGDCLVRCLL